MTNIEVLRYVVGHMEKYPDPAIRKALVEKGVGLDRIEAALVEAKRLRKEAALSGQGIDLGQPEEPVSWTTRIIFALLGAGAIAAAGKWLMSR